jgi:chemotaxis protein MotB
MLLGQVTITELEGKLKVKLLNSFLFASGKAKVSEEGMGVLQKLIEVLKEVEDHEIRVEGHTDNVPISEYLASRHPTNWDLSAARAINVVKYLQEQGIDPAALSSSAFGEHRPVAGNETEEDRAKNRRIEIILVPIVLSDNNVSSTL